jgi:zinc protease
MAGKRWWSTAFPDHPYGRPVSGTLDSVPHITADDLKTYVRQVFARDNLKVAVVGDIDAASVGAMLDEVFGALPARSERAPVAAARPQGLGRRIVVELDVPQAVVTFGGPGIARKDPDFIAAYIVNHILGGGTFSSRLYHEVREKRGLAYSVYSSLVWLDHAAMFMGGTGTRAERAGETIDLIEQEIRRLVETGPTEDELARAKSYLKGAYPLGFDTSSKIASQLVQIQLDDLGIDYPERRSSLIDAVTIGDVRRVAKRLLESGLLVTVVGRPAGVNAKQGG